MKWAEWWFLNGGSVHQFFKERAWTDLRNLAVSLPKAAWDEQQKRIDELEKENKRLSDELFKWKIVAGII